MWEKTDELQRKMRRREHLVGPLQGEERTEYLQELAATALSEKAFDTARQSYIELEDGENVRRVGEACLTECWLEDASAAFCYLNDRKGLLRVVKAAQQEGGWEVTMQGALRDYLGKNVAEGVERKFYEWSRNLGIADAYMFDISQTVNLAHHLADKYDLGIGIARGGLFSTYVFGLFGLETKVVQPNRDGESTSFNWVTPSRREEFDGKRIVVFDKDVSSGRTAKEMYGELARFQPGSTDLVLNNDPRSGTHGLGTNHSAVPEEFSKVWYPRDFTYDKFDKAVETLEQTLQI